MLLSSSLAAVGLACNGCGALKSPTNRLSKCAACKRVSYCGAGCQRANWPNHKSFCKTFRIALSSSSTTRLIGLHSSLADEMLHPSTMSLFLFSLAKSILMEIGQPLGRAPNVIERDLVLHEPWCLACGRSESVMRVQAGLSGATNTVTSLQKCQDCDFGFYCSKAHWDLARHSHQEVPCPTGLNGLSRCATNKSVYENLKFIHVRNRSRSGDYCWAPKRTKAQWTSLKGVGWSDFEDEFRKDHSSEVDREVKFRGATEGLGMAMTILWALENLNSDDSWTKKETLNIHIIGALERELHNADVFEEILHRLPEVKTLKLELVNPELGMLNPSYRKTSTLNMKACADCKRKGRKWIRVIASDDYETYVRKQVSFKIPDLAIAFQTGASGSPLPDLCPTYDKKDFPWIGPMKFLVSRKIPSVFTAYNERGAVVEADMLRKVGAKLHPALGPVANPWSSLMLTLEPFSVTDFYSSSGWLSGGFR